MTSRFSRKTSAAIIALCATAIPFASFFAPNAQAQEAQSQCGAVHIVTAQGTGGSATDRGNDVADFAEGKLARTMVDKFPGQVTAWQVAYPSSAGAIHSAIAVNHETTTFGDSRLTGAQSIVEHVTQFRENCPGTKIMIAGYSQGASVAGDAAALIANGASQNTTSKDVMGVILYADPGRSGNSAYTGTQGSTAYIPLPDGAQYQRNGEYVSAQHEKNTVGWTGQRSLPFTGMEGRVISLCNPRDLACSVDDKTFLRAVADSSDKNWLPSPESYRNKADINTMLTQGKLTGILLKMLGEGGVSMLVDGNTQGFAALFHKLVAEDSTLNQQEKETLYNAETEMRYIFTLLRSDMGYGHTVPNDVIISHIAQSAGSSLENSELVPQELKAPLSLAMSTIAGKDTSSIPADAKQRMSDAISYMLEFPQQHATYFSDAYKVNGQSAEQWAMSAVEEGINNVINDTPYTVDVGSNPRTPDTELEVSDPTRLDDGLRGIVDPHHTPTNFDPRTVINKNFSGLGNTASSSQNSPQTSEKSTTSRSSDNDNEKSETPSVSESAQTAAPRPVSGASVVGPSVNTGGEVSQSFLSRLWSTVTS